MALREGGKALGRQTFRRIISSVFPALMTTTISLAQNQTGFPAVYDAVQADKVAFVMSQGSCSLSILESGEFVG